MRILQVLLKHYGEILGRGHAEHYATRELARLSITECVAYYKCV